MNLAFSFSDGKRRERLSLDGPTLVKINGVVVYFMGFFQRTVKFPNQRINIRPTQDGVTPYSHERYTFAYVSPLFLSAYNFFVVKIKTAEGMKSPARLPGTSTFFASIHQQVFSNRFLCIVFKQINLYYLHLP